MFAKTPTAEEENSLITHNSLHDLTCEFMMRDGIGCVKEKICLRLGVLSVLMLTGVEWHECTCFTVRFDKFSFASM